MLNLLYLLPRKRKIIINPKYKIIAAAGQNADDFPDEPLHSYVTRVTETPLSGADTVLSAAQKRETARQILYDAAYERAKYEIMSPIEQFRQ